ncbi:unnamed protein product [Phytomonas sp. EM1]|nr:unnamed protein product [Phytomonas sp. EM1]|eukprot:CCW61887.1 unnamed protein product [Phytomonas sp. isolate EM1]
MEQKDAGATQEQSIQHTAGTNNDTQGSLLQLVAPFIESAPPGKLKEVVFHLKSLLLRLLAVRNHGAPPHSQIPANELHNFLQSCIPALCLRRILQKDGSIASLATTKLPQFRDQLSQSTTNTRDDGKVSSGLAQRRIHLVLSHTNHLLSWVIKVNSAKSVDGSGYVCDAEQVSRGSASSWHQQRSMLSASLSDLTASLPPGIAALPSYGVDIKNENMFPWLSDHTETSHSTVENSFLSAAATETGRRGRKNRFCSSFEGDANTIAILSDLKKFFSHVPSIFLAGGNEDPEVRNTKDNSGSAQEHGPSSGDEEAEVEEEEDLFRDLYAVSYGFDRLENVFFDLYWGLYVEIDVVVGRCIRVISFSAVDEAISSAQDLPTSLFYLFHQELKLQRQPEGKDTAKEAVGATEHVNSAEGALSGAADRSNELGVNIPLFDTLFSGVRKRLETELQAQFQSFEDNSVATYVGVKGLDKEENLSNLLKEYREKWSAAGVAKMRENDAGAPDPPLAWRVADRMAMGAASAFTAVVWLRGFLVNSRVDLLPGEHMEAEPPVAPKVANPEPIIALDPSPRDLNSSTQPDKPSVLPSTLSVTYSKSRGAPVRGWCSMWTSRYELCRAEQRHGGVDLASPKDFSLHKPCGAEVISDDSPQCHRRALPLGVADAPDAPSSTPPGNDGKALKQTNNMTDDGGPSLESYKSPFDVTTREACSFIISATSEVWLFHEPAAGGGTDNTRSDFIHSSSEAGCGGAWGIHNQETSAAFPATPGGMHQRWVVRCPMEGLPTASVNVDVVTDAVLARISKHEQMVRDSIIRVCNRILRPKRLIGICYPHQEAKSPLSSLLPQCIPFLASKTNFDPLRYDESILCVPFPTPSQEES